VQVDPKKPKLKPPGTKRLRPEYDGLLSNFAFKLNLRRHTEDAAGEDEHSGGDLAMRRPMLDCSNTSTWPSVGRPRLALTKKLLAIRRQNPVFANLGSQAGPRPSRRSLFKST
jgi:hypothetical protein